MQSALFPSVEFPTSFDTIMDRVPAIQPKKYCRDRNFIDGHVTKLSPYVSRGVISTKDVLEEALRQGHDLNAIEKFVQELAWRDYWQQNWRVLKERINEDIRQPQTPVKHHQIPISLTEATTGIQAVDQAINELYETGYMHNHVRMYTASVACNIAQSYWLAPARWMYYYLLDADWASNALSWQWVAGSNAGKSYYANQENINKYCYTQQRNTFLDVPYSVFDQLDVPQQLEETAPFNLITNLPKQKTSIEIDSDLPTYLYNWYNLDPNWTKGITANKVLILEPSIFEQYPISDQSVQFMLDLGENIEGLQVYIGEFTAFKQTYPDTEIHFKEHPLNQYEGIEHPRTWLSDVEGYHRSFFAFWKKVKKQLHA